MWRGRFRLLNALANVLTLWREARSNSMASILASGYREGEGERREVGEGREGKEGGERERGRERQIE